MDNLVNKRDCEDSDVGYEEKKLMNHARTYKKWGYNYLQMSSQIELKLIRLETAR